MDPPSCGMRSQGKQQSLRSRTTQRAGFALSSFSLSLQSDLPLTDQPVSGGKQQRTQHSSGSDRVARIRPQRFSLSEPPTCIACRRAKGSEKMPSNGSSSMHAGGTCSSDRHALTLDSAECQLLNMYKIKCILCDMDGRRRRMHLLPVSCYPHSDGDRHLGLTLAGL